MVLEAGGCCLATGVKGLPLPLLGSLPHTPKSGRKRAACNPVGRSGVVRCSRQGAGGGSGRFASKEMRTLSPSFSARVQWSLTSSEQFACGHT